MTWLASQKRSGPIWIYSHTNSTRLRRPTAIHPSFVTSASAMYSIASSIVRLAVYRKATICARIALLLVEVASTEQRQCDSWSLSQWPLYECFTRPASTPGTRPQLSKAAKATAKFKTIGVTGELTLSWVTKLIPPLF